MTRRKLVIREIIIPLVYELGPTLPGIPRYNIVKATPRASILHPAELATSIWCAPIIFSTYSASYSLCRRRRIVAYIRSIAECCDHDIRARLHHVCRDDEPSRVRRMTLFYGLGAHNRRPRVKQRYIFRIHVLAHLKCYLVIF